ncbi:NAD(P)-dependent oxidoreductase [Demequina sp. NBRC 110057]|uniref:NAD(P)-dependent oxidoreductase n=1 Tax=Demequina sp. NBRC 110057 TaxID=1570346 RepID=UPI0009FC8965|nr:NAD(P)-dependent oxidoreductase [Demequina sp. NBRC 110057]
MSLTVAVLGTGIMGAAMARNLIAAGHDVRVWNRTRERAEPLAADGATVAGSPAHAVAGADAVLTMLFDAAAVREVMAEATPAVPSGAFWIQCTTTSPEDVASLARLADDHGLAFVDAPVLGTRAPAEAGQLTVLAAATPAARPTATEVFDAVGSRTVWTGDDPAAASATRMKLVANSWVLAVNNAAGETTALAETLGVDLDDFLGLIEGGPLDNGYLRAKSGLIRDDALTPPSFAVDTAAKDAALILGVAATKRVRLDGIEAAEARLTRASAKGHGDEDMAAAYRATASTDHAENEHRDA